MDHCPEKLPDSRAGPGVASAGCAVRGVFTPTIPVSASSPVETRTWPSRARREKRESLLDATCGRISKVKRMVGRGQLQTAAEIGIRACRVADQLQRQPFTLSAARSRQRQERLPCRARREGRPDRRATPHACPDHVSLVASHPRRRSSDCKRPRGPGPFWPSLSTVSRGREKSRRWGVRVGLWGGRAVVMGIVARACPSWRA